jgi:hypothetical protein
MDSKFNNSGAQRAKAMLVLLWLLCAAVLPQAFASDVKLAWDGSPDSGVTGYKIYYGVVGAAKQTLDVGLNTGVTLTGLVTGKVYEFKVTAYNSTAESDGSNVLAYATPETLGIADGSTSTTFSGNLNLSWNASPDAAVVGYKLYYGLVGATKQTMNVGLKTNCTVTGLLAGKTYEFKVTAYTATAESDPSNLLTYTTATGTSTGGAGSGYFTLTVNPFKNGYVQVSPRGSGPLGNLYPAGTQVTLLGTPKAGATFSGWNINGVDYPSNPQMITINSDTTVTPFFKVSSSVAQDTTNPGPSMTMEMLSGHRILSIGGEIGAWTLESSSDLRNWGLAATGMSSEQLEVPFTTDKTFFRVRAYNAATDL